MAEREALYWQTEDGKVRCRLCPFMCLIGENETGQCLVRKNRGGVLVPLTYGQVTSTHLDPIEKKPLYHFHPGMNVLSLGTWGCNLHCLFCQNCEISQREMPTRRLAPAEAVQLAQRQPDNVGLAFTYNEPLIWYEYVLDTAQLAHEAGLKAVLVTNGLINPKPLEELLPFIDALNIDVKSMDDGFYARLCDGKLRPVLMAAEQAVAGGVLVEVTNLVIPGENDAEDDLRALIEWVAGSLGRDTPLHFSRYHPAYRMDNPPTPAETLARAYELASEHLDYVYVGNIHLPGTNDTRCPGCGETIIERSAFQVLRTRLDGPKCGNCGKSVHVVL